MVMQVLKAHPSLDIEIGAFGLQRKIKKTTENIESFYGRFHLNSELKSQK